MAVALGSNFLVAVNQFGVVLTCGQNDAGQLGLGLTPDADTDTGQRILLDAVEYNCEIHGYESASRQGNALPNYARRRAGVHPGKLHFAGSIAPWSWAPKPSRHIINRPSYGHTTNHRFSSTRKTVVLSTCLLKEQNKHIAKNEFIG